MPATTLQLRRGTTAQHATFTGALGEVTIDTDKDCLVVHDGVTAGGFPTALAASVATSLALKANAANAALTGAPTAPNPTAGTRGTRLATMQMFADEFPSTDSRIHLPNGKFIQMGFAQSIAGVVDITYPMAFPGAVMRTIFTTFAGNTTVGNINASGLAGANFNVVNAATGALAGTGIGVSWLAIGR